MNADQFIAGYIECALWSSTDEDGNQLDDQFDESDLSDECRASMREGCTDFIKANAEDLQAYLNAGRNAAGAGHDFWLTRNRHGAGFWDRGLGQLGERLSEAARVYGSVDLYVTDEGKIAS